VCGAAIAAKAKTIEGVEQWPFRAVGNALEVIPRTLAQNCGADTVRLLTELRVRAAVACVAGHVRGDAAHLCCCSVCVCAVLLT
jgi:chaperonin GroEL (HSP60 family)